MKTQDLDRLHWMDYGLSALASSLALFSVGMGLSNPEIGYLLMGILLLGTLISYAIHRFAPTKLTLAGGGIYSIVGIACFLNPQGMNALLPGEGVPQQLLMAGVLAWMITLGSFTLWRDTIIIFQAVPTIALFGLVGTWDTFNGAPVAFFGFLLCFAILFARAHGRLMMRQANESGAIESTGEAFLPRLKSGPWRWMAGPEWALGSALAIILLSAIGAPVIQEGMKGVTSQVQVNVPRPQPQQAANLNTDPFRGMSSGSTSVGLGPRTLRNRIVFSTNLSEPYHLRAHTYDEYTGRGWRVIQDYANRRGADADVNDPESNLNQQRTEAAKFRVFTYGIRFRSGLYDSVPIPGEAHGVPDFQVSSLRPDGTLKVLTNFQQRFFQVRLPSLEGATGNAGKGISPIYRDPQVRTTDRVRDFAKRAVAGAKNDLEKANRLKAAIEATAGYDLQAEAIPTGEDVTDNFLFVSKRGPCDLFATAMVVTARAAGLPARYATGFYPARGVLSERGGLVVHESEAHAWAEIYLEGAGWTPFDPTEGAEDLGEPTEDLPLWEQSWVRTLGLILGGLALVLGPAGIVFLMRQRALPSDPQARKLGQAYGVFVRAIEKTTGKPKRPGQTPSEYLEVVRNQLGPKAEVAETMTAKFVHGLYSPATTDAEALLQEAKQTAREIRRR